MGKGLRGPVSGRFLCQRCGWCCQNQLIRVFTLEIRAILDFLRHQSNEAFEDHISACLAYEGKLSPYDYTFQKRLDVLRAFFRPYEVEFFEGDLIVVKTHVLVLLPETKRCVFYNPLTSACFIYPARPLTCRMFPYEVKDGHLVLINEEDNCPGVGLGDPVNRLRHKRLSLMCQQLLHQEDDLFQAFVRERGLRIAQRPPSTSVERRTLINPFVERGLIPALLLNENLELASG
jgi:Fe-S-cluster containining protein